jgi:hypothetical protein
MSSNLQDLKDELINDPLVRGYVGMTDAQAAASLLTKNRPRNKVTLSASEIFEAIDTDEYLALSATEKDRVNIVLNLGDSIQIGPASKARAFILAAFAGAAGAITRPALAALAVEQISRATELFGGDIPGVYGIRSAEEAVAAARAIP